MSRSEFRWNKKRKHYAYLFKDKGKMRLNILITSKSYVTKHKNGKTKVVLYNVPIMRHPNNNKQGIFYLIPRIYIDSVDSFGEIIYVWRWDINDKRKVKRIKKNKCDKKKKIGYDSTNNSGQSPM